MSSNKTSPRLASIASASQYQPLPTRSNMDNPARILDDTDRSSLESGDIVDVGGGLPPTYSSQQLMPSSETDSMQQPRRPSSFVRGRNALVHVGQSQWFTMFVLCFVNLINYMDRFTIAGVLTDLQNDFKIGDDSGGLLQTAFVLFYMVFAPLFGYLGDRYSRRWIMAFGVLIWSTTTLLGSFMPSFGWFISFRAIVGIGEASYSTIAPTLISDMFVRDMRSKMLALFYFAIPVGSGLGYIVGSATANAAGNWRWALRVTPFLGIVAVFLILLIKEPARGESEGSDELEPTTYKEDLKHLVKNRSFMFSTAGFTCVAFVAGALSWWGPKFIHFGLRLQPGNEDLTLSDVSLKFGAIAMMAGIIGVPLGSFLSQALVKRWSSVDPLVCAVGLLTSVVFMTAGIIFVSKYTLGTYILVFLAEVTLNMNWAVVADILLYVVVPTRRSTAEAFQILISHAFGDAGSPFLVGVISEAIKSYMNAARSYSGGVIDAPESMSLTLGDSVLNTTTIATIAATTATTIVPENFESFGLNRIMPSMQNLIEFEALQYALFSTSFVEVLGGIFFLITACFILEDKQRATDAVREATLNAAATRPRGGREVHVDID